MNLERTFMRCLIGAVTLGCCSPSAMAQEILLEGANWPSHLQGVCTDGTNIWWSHMVVLAKTDLEGRVLRRSPPVPSHHGDLCYANGKLYVAVNLGLFDREDGGAKNFVYVYDPDTFELLEKHPVPELAYGAGCMTEKGGHFFLAGGLPESRNSNWIYEYDADFDLVAVHRVASGWTLFGIQTIDAHDGRFYLGCYGGRRKRDGYVSDTRTFVLREDFSIERVVNSNTSEGQLALGGRLWRARIRHVKPEPKERDLRYTCRLLPAPEFDPVSAPDAPRNGETWKESANTYSNCHPMFGCVDEWILRFGAKPGCVK